MAIYIIYSWIRHENSSMVIFSIVNSYIVYRRVYKRPFNKDVGLSGLYLLRTRIEGWLANILQRESQVAKFRPCFATCWWRKNPSQVAKFRQSEHQCLRPPSRSSFVLLHYHHDIPTHQLYPIISQHRSQMIPVFKAQHVVHWFFSCYKYSISNNELLLNPLYDPRAVSTKRASFWTAVIHVDQTTKVSPTSVTKYRSDRLMDFFLSST